jgi:hypothetical protein
MSPLFIAFCFLICMIGSFILSIVIRPKIPDTHFNDDAKFVIELSIGLIAAMAALVLGLLTAATKETFDEYNNSVKNLAANLLELDNLLARYGEDAGPIRVAISSSMRQQRDMIWGSLSEREVRAKLNHSKPAAESVESLVQALNPHTDAQRSYIERTLELLQEIKRIRWQILADSSETVPGIFLIVLGLWLSVLFASFGLFSPRNATVFLLLVLSAFSVAGAVFVVLEMGNPLNGLVKVSSQPIDDFLSNLAP